MKPYKLNYHPKRRWLRLLVPGLAALVVLLLAVLIGVKYLYEQNLKPVDSSDETEVVFVVQEGDSVQAVAGGLARQELIRSADAFTQYVRSKGLGEDFKAGTYSLKKAYDVPTIVSIIVEGRVDNKLFTILPGKRLDQIREAFVKAGFTAAETDSALEPSQYAGHPALAGKPAAVSLEGYLYPDSYELLLGTTKPQTIIGQALDEMAEALNEQVRTGFATQGLEVYQGITLASVVEREVSASKPEDRPQVAQVFLKRLKEDIALESDATAVYGVVLDGKLDEISGTGSILRYDSAYNTYNVKGLPPTPVSNVSASSLLAVAQPAATDYLFFVAGQDCVTRFSRTFAEHEAFIAQFGVANEASRCN